jgi:phosphoglycolate phosphatase-like HAD superfamily hydrolase
VGDTRWDAEAAKKVGLVFYGVLTGGGTKDELCSGGADDVFSDLRSLLSYLERARS